MVTQPSQSQAVGGGVYFLCHFDFFLRFGLFPLSCLPLLMLLHHHHGQDQLFITLLIQPAGCASSNTKVLPSFDSFGSPDSV